ncbi:MAG: pknB [Solirubrobacterales bacterium]|nr:pknB [Solirubrobacterales bacterium]
MTGRLAEGSIVDGRYRVITRLGSGGMADVYCAEDLQLGRKVALKLLYRRFAEDGDFVERFRREASSAAGLQHPNVVGVYDRGEADGMQYIAMEYLDGRTLKDIVREEGPLAPGRAVDLVEQVLRAARFAHKRGIIHRDLKPHNVIVDSEDCAKVTDFGIALAGASDMTETGSIMGTAQYLSPEQAQGQPVDARSDLYSVGIMLYELLTGRVPFDGDSAVSIALQQVSAQPVPPSQLNPAVTPALERAVLRALAKHPDDRPDDAEAFIAELEAARSGIGDTTAMTSVAPPLAAAAVGPRATMSDGTSSYELAAMYGVPTEPPPPGPVDPLLDDDPNGVQRWWPALLAALVVVALIVGGLLLFGGDKGVTVPNVIGAEQATAEVTLRGKGFSTDTVEKTDATKPKGQVIGQTPGPGEKADKGDTITLTISAGPGEGRVPEVADMGRRAANKALVAAGFKVQEREQPDDTIRKDHVIETIPGAGTSLEKGETVVVVVSSGPGKVAVPSVVGRTQDQAESDLTALGLKVESVEQESEDAEAGRVLAQDRPAGTEVTKGTTVKITVAKKPEATDVPSVVGKSVGDAVSELSGAGFKVVQRTEDVTTPDEDGTVLSQSPAGGRAKPGSTVTITIGNFNPPLNPEPAPTTTTTPTTPTTPTTTTTTP